MKTLAILLILLYSKNSSVRVVKVDMDNTLLKLDTTNRDSLTITISKK